MRKIGLLIIALLLAPLGVQAQSDFFSAKRVKSTPQYSVRGALNLSNLRFSGDYAHGGTKVGGALGVVVDVPIWESLWLQTGASYSMKGMRYHDDYQSTLLSYTEDEKVTACFVHVPVLASYRFNASEKVQLQVNFGPYVAFGVNGKWKHKYNDADYVAADGTNYGDVDCFGEGFLRRFDIGLQLGVGFDINRVYAGIRNEWGLRNLSDGHRDYMGHEVSARNRTFAFEVGYRF